MSPTKRRRLDSQYGSADFTDAFLSEVNAEINTEIALKHRLTGTLESRIAWALILHESIKNENGQASQDTFQNVALDALSVVEQTSDHILCKDPMAPPSIHASRVARPAPRKVVPFNFKSKPSFLYIRSNTLMNAAANSLNDLYLLQCPRCCRTTFTSLQGLLNHARLTHNLEWGTHDECIRACAVVSNDLDVDAGIEVGIGPGGVLPGLRTIFQMAVGTQNFRDGDSVGSSIVPSIVEPKATSSAANHLIQTLGFHGDSPALAPFLGKEVTRRQIKVWDEDCEVDFETVPALGSQCGSRPWKMPFTQRNFSDSAVEESEKETPERGNTAGRGGDSDMGEIVAKPEGNENGISNPSRFHFITRIVITDRSLWIPVEQRTQEHRMYSHKWMISVDSPSYAHHITTVLNSVRVTPSDATISIPIPPTTSSPPFVVVGFSDRPFLARVELSFSGTISQPMGSSIPEQKVVFQHWVDLDPLEGQPQFTGQDQVVDVELDRHTALKPPQLGYTPIGTKSLWKHVIEPEAVLKSKGEEDVYQTLRQFTEPTRPTLNKLVKQFPMTLSNSKSNRSQAAIIPYMLVNSPADLGTLVVGRRKAIEWGRARAIRDAYNQEVKTSQDQTLMTLSVADVYSWLSDNGHFVREKEMKKEPYIKQEFPGDKAEEEQTQLQEQTSHWCRICGLEANIHSNAIPKKELLEDGDMANEPARQPYVGVSILASDERCYIVPRVLQVVQLPRIDLRQMQSSQYLQPPPHELVKFTTLDRECLLSMVVPNLTWSIHKLVHDLGLSKIYPSVELDPADARRQLASYPLDNFGEHRMDVQRNLAPLGLLTHVTKQFLHMLIKGGLEVADRDKVIASGLLSSAALQRGGSRKAAGKQATPRLLTPTHILSGILSRGRGRSSSPNNFDAVVLSSLSRLGVDADPNFVPCSRQGEPEAQVKMEV